MAIGPPRLKSLYDCLPFRRGADAEKFSSHDRKLQATPPDENLFARIERGRRIATRCDKCGALCLSAIRIAATVMFWVWGLTQRSEVSQKIAI